jgi:hypothetical protein
MTVSGKNRSQGAKISRWGVAALPLSVFVGVVLGAGVGAAVANIGIGVAIGARESDCWVACEYVSERGEWNNAHKGETPEDAVARLWLSLNHSAAVHCTA